MAKATCFIERCADGLVYSTYSLLQQFEGLIVEAYNCLRKHASVYITLLLLLDRASPTIDLKQGRKTLERELIQRFNIGKVLRASG